MVIIMTSGYERSSGDSNPSRTLPGRAAARGPRRRPRGVRSVWLRRSLDAEARREGRLLARHPLPALQGQGGAFRLPGRGELRTVRRGPGKGARIREAWRSGRVLAEGGPSVCAVWSRERERLRVRVHTAPPGTESRAHAPLRLRAHAI